MALGAVAEWLGRGLQSLVHRFESGRRLEKSPAIRGFSFFAGNTSGTVREGGECFVDVAELPLLASEEGVADDAGSVDRVEGGALAEGAQPRLDLVGAVDREVWVGEQRKGERVRRGERPGLVEASGGECE